MDRKKATVFEGVATFLESCSIGRAADCVRLRFPVAIDDERFAKALQQLTSCLYTCADPSDNQLADTIDTDDTVNKLLQKLVKSGYCPPVEAACDTDISTTPKSRESQAAGFAIPGAEPESPTRPVGEVVVNDGHSPNAEVPAPDDVDLVNGSAADQGAATLVPDALGAPQSSAHYVPRRPGVTEEWDIDDEYRDEVDSGYRIHEAYEQELWVLQHEQYRAYEASMQPVQIPAGSSAAAPSPAAYPQETYQAPLIDDELFSGNATTAPASVVFVPPPIDEPSSAVAVESGAEAQQQLSSQLSFDMVPADENTKTLPVIDEAAAKASSDRIQAQDYEDSGVLPSFGGIAEDPTERPAGAVVEDQSGAIYQVVPQPQVADGMPMAQVDPYIQQATTAAMPPEYHDAQAQMSQSQAQALAQAQALQNQYAMQAQQFQPIPAPHALTGKRKPKRPENSNCTYAPSGDSFYPVEFDSIQYDSLQLKIVYERDRTGFEESKEFPIRMNSVVAARYQVLEYLGSAAFSRAVQALDLETNKMVCMKIIKNSKDFFDQSLDEIKLLRLLNASGNVDEKHCLGLLDYFYHKEHLIIITELLRDNLYEFSRFNRESGDAPYFTLGRLQRISRQILLALEYVHSLRLIHCDLKPENILIKSYSRCEVKVIDFGSSCFIDDHLSTYVQSRSYRAPEVMLGLPYDQKIDIWSLGCIIAELWTGYVLFQNDSVQSLLARIIGIIGRFPADVLSRGRHVPQYFTQTGTLYKEVENSSTADRGMKVHLMLPKKSSLRQRLRTRDELFLDFITHLLELDPSKRPSSKEALQHAWLSPGKYPDGL